MSLVPPPEEGLTTVTLYDEVTGDIKGTVTCHAEHIALNVGAGLKFVRGVHRADCRRVNVATGEVEPYQPAAPDADHVWDASDERWTLPAVKIAARLDSADALARIERLERVQQRKIREFLLGDATQTELRAVLRVIDNQIAALRAKILP